MGSRACVLAATVAALALAAGCGDEPAPSGSAQGSATTATTSATATTPAPATTATKTSGKPCELLTGADAAPVLGLGNPPGPTASSRTECEYSGSNGLDTVGIAVEAERFDASLVDAVFSALNEDKVTRVGGLGDAAFSYALNDLGAQMHVWAKGRYLTVTVIITSRRVETAPLARALAETALSRL